MFLYLGCVSSLDSITQVVESATFQGQRSIERDNMNSVPKKFELLKEL